MTWEELEQLPEEIADRIELWDGRVMWMASASAGHDTCLRRMANSLEHATRLLKSPQPEECWRVITDHAVHLDKNNLSDFLKPDFHVYRCKSLAEKIWAEDVLMVGEVLSPCNTPKLQDAKLQRYAEAGIPWYWEVELDDDRQAITSIVAHVHCRAAEMRTGVQALHPDRYFEVARWTPADEVGVDIDHPFPIRIPWTDLEL
ncbi:Uma2 family endonuclease [Nocardia stercoris]|uniref:Uma2 family endonuclease n=1 Tax=Nocardia stercoris TaxID=2483361 RepID=A0A3M2L5H7_9NOCA|nr:Uma2 family endonuclease [Nocardia stercoris]RMI32909.1 Uma2 family endonuclease [Nocardia stercoris]